MLGHASAGLFSLTNKQLSRFFTATDRINQVTLFMLGCFVLRVDQSLSEGVTRFKMNREVVENPRLKEVQSIFLKSKNST